MIFVKCQKRVLMTPAGREWIAKKEPLTYQQIIQAESLFKIAQENLARLMKEIPDDSAK